MTKSWRRGSRFTAFRTGFNNERPIALIQVNMRIHIILNSHLDPVWLWRREQGIDEVIATARTACNLLEEFPQIHITRGEAWFYETVERLDPQLFGRIRTLVAAGRWHIVGGWYVQPDCNHASPESYLRHGRIGGRYFREKFGVKVNTGYNVDSFGHNANLPDYYAAAGISNYVMMRPDRDEKPDLPGNVFRWRSQHWAEMRVFRIAKSYCTSGPDPVAHIATNIEEALAEATPGMGQTMCFVGVGNHGGGPTRDEIRWVLDHLDYKPGVTLQFSHPDAFFESISSFPLPVYQGELQHHAVGCHSAASRIKRELRAAENLLSQAQCAVPEANLDEPWKKVLFATFHDILPGSAIASAMADIYDDLGYARSAARELITGAIRIRNASLPGNECQRLIFDNLGGRIFTGCIHVEPWLGFAWEEEANAPHFRLEDENGVAVPCQRVEQEALTPVYAFAVQLTIPAGGRRILLLRKLHGRATPPVRLAGDRDAAASCIGNGVIRAVGAADGVSSLTAAGREYLASPVAVAVYEDASDTWSHGQTSYSTSGLFQFSGDGRWIHQECGQLLNSSFTVMSGGGCALHYSMATEKDSPVLRLHLRLGWQGLHRIAKLLIRPDFAACDRIDGCQGGTVPRRLDGEEYPFFNFIALTGQSRGLAVVSADVFGADVQPDGTIRLTLLRSPYYAHHAPTAAPDTSMHAVTDQGEHDYHISIIPMQGLDLEAIADEAYRQTRPVCFSECTLGMGGRG